MTTKYGKRGLLLAIPALLICLGGCTAKISNLMLASTENVDLSQKYVLAASDVSAKTSSMWFLLFMSVEDQSYYKALGDCLAQHDGDLMTDVKITTSSFWFIVGTYNEYKVQGNVWKRVDAVGSADLAPEDIYTLGEQAGQPVLISHDGRDVHEVTSTQ